MGRYRLSPLADQDLWEIRAYIAERDPAAAERVLTDIEAKLELLAEAPLLGRERTELKSGYRASWCAVM